MSNVLFICSGDTINELKLIRDNNITINKIYFHDILYEKDIDLRTEIVTRWKREYNLIGSQIYFSYDLESLKTNLGDIPNINYLFGINIQELYSYHKNLSPDQIREEFERQYRSRSLCVIAEYLSMDTFRNPSFEIFIDYHDGRVENSFENFLKERKEMSENMRKVILSDM